MTIEFGSLHRWRSILGILLLIAIFNTVCHVSPDYNPYVVHLHEVLNSFTIRGQTTVELFAPLSTIVGSSPDGRVFLTVASHIAWLLVGATFLRMLQAYKVVLVSNLFTRTALYALLASMPWFSRSVRHEHLLSLLNEVADASLTLALVTTTAWGDNPQWLRVLLFFGLGEALVLTSYALGCNYIDAIVAYFLLSVARARILARKVVDSRYSAASLACEGISNLSISFIVCPISTIILSGALLPISESAAGGNYNLRYLSAAARRDLTPFPAIRPSSTQAAPNFGLHHGTAYTMYVPGAGFLWSDSMMWKQSLQGRLRSSIDHYDDEVDKYWSIEGSYRVFFQDKFVERYPWEVQTFPRQTQKRHTPQMVHSGSTIRLYDSIASRYLCVIPGERVVSEAGYFSMDDSIEQTTNRIRVGTNPNPTSLHCDWTAYYDPTKDDGISFYSHEHQCNLATTFRSLSDPNSIQSNDTVLRILNLKLEVSCTTSASKASSRLFIIERNARNKSPENAKGALQKRKPTIADVGYFRRAMDYFEARRRLGRFRRYYSHLQEDEVGTSINDIKGETRPLDLLKPDILMCSLYLSVWLLDLLAYQRFPNKGAKSFRYGLPARSQLGGFFVLFHLCAYYILGMKMLYSSRAAGLVSLYGLTEYMIQRV